MLVNVMVGMGYGVGIRQLPYKRDALPNANIQNFSKKYQWSVVTHEQKKTGIR